MENYKNSQIEFKSLSDNFKAHLNDSYFASLTEKQKSLLLRKFEASLNIMSRSIAIDIKNSFTTNINFK